MCVEIQCVIYCKIEGENIQTSGSLSFWLHPDLCSGGRKILQTEKQTENRETKHRAHSIFV